MKSTDKFVLVLVASLALLLAGCGGGSSTTAPPVDPGPTAAEQAIMDAKAALTTAQAGVSGDMMTDAQMLAAYQAIERAANNLVMVLKANGGSLDDVEMATAARENAMDMVSDLEMKIADAQAAADKAMMAMAAKLSTAIGDDPLNLTNRLASYAAGVLQINVNTLGNQLLAEDKTAMVAPLHGWTGSMHTAKPDSGAYNGATFTAQTYGNVGEPTPGKKFGGAAANNEFEYALVDGAVTVDGATATNAPLVGGSSFDHTAGVKQFKLPSPNPSGATMVNVSGSFHGVSGTYTCTPGDGNTCAAQVAAEGFTLGLRADAGGAFTASSTAWVFKPSDPNARVTSTPDGIYAVYGWWLYEPATGDAVVSAYDAVIGAVANAAIDGLNGTATYKGGAAGKYAIRAGAVNDAGHFTADAELMADFSANTVTGTIDNFMGSDGMSRDWSVALKKSAVSNSGVIVDATFGGGEGRQMTEWTMDGNAASADGEWEGQLYENNPGGVPKVGTGTFHSTYNNIGHMVGAFGVNLEE